MSIEACNYLNFGAMVFFELQSSDIFVAMKGQYDQLRCSAPKYFMNSITLALI